MFYSAFALVFYALYAVLYLAGLALAVWGVRDLRRDLGGWVRLAGGIVLCLIPSAVIVSAWLGY